MTGLSHEEKYTAWDNWWSFWVKQKHNFTGHQDEEGGYQAFEAFVGDNVFKTAQPSADAVHKVKLLAGPHHFTILKALVARKE
jgi:hypothetical protein